MRASSAQLKACVACASALGPAAAAGCPWQPALAQLPSSSRPPLPAGHTHHLRGMYRSTISPCSTGSSMHRAVRTPAIPAQLVSLPAARCRPAACSTCCRPADSDACWVLRMMSGPQRRAAGAGQPLPHRRPRMMAEARLSTAARAPARLPGCSGAARAAFTSSFFMAPGASARGD